MEFRKNDKLVKVFDSFFAVYALTVDKADYVPKKALGKIYRTIYKDFKRSLRSAEREYKKEEGLTLMARLKSALQFKESNRVKLDKLIGIIEAWTVNGVNKRIDTSSLSTDIEGLDAHCDCGEC